VLVRLVSGEHDGTPFIALADNLEEQISAGFVDGKIADFINT